ncbi:bifunctional 4'-phosphopantothenoylcysteine decarboxylase/phosphopantothenoylcysteine synthetase [candidate division KSB1 bacterium 4484_219]|nr:MAG: bifunctional 4'-phosphopantothenoylcysteine decarboxylase/phosphopantothenoylcysteine synthetase [candidate division KSB1 bacterium 4484_219]
MGLFSNKKLLVGVTGGIAAYKTCELVRELRKEEAEVQIVMTKAAQKFVAPLTFETLSDREVLVEMFPQSKSVATRHVDVAQWADCFVVCPATANILGKVAAGIADDLLSTMIMVAGGEKTIFCPAMNSNMYANPIVQRNIETLQRLGYSFVSPEWGELACHAEGLGRLASLERILGKIKHQLLGSEELKGVRVLVTAGPTQEPIDPVRFITNASSGKMGFALAEAAAIRGAEVTLISGPTNLRPSEDIHFREVRTTEQMYEAVHEVYPNTDVVIMAAAVSDYRPSVYSEHKLKKSDNSIVLTLEKNPDILASLGKNKNGRILVGFAVETTDELKHGKQKLKAKNLDLIVVNNPKQRGAGFATDTNVVTIIDRQQHVESLPKLSKPEVAQHILNRIVELIFEAKSKK